LGWFKRRSTQEERATEGTTTVSFEDSLLQAMLGGGSVTREMALQVPTISGGIDLIAGIVAGTPIKLYRDRGGRAEEVKDDVRSRILNDETGDTLNANNFWHAMVRDYYLGKGAYAYIHKVKGEYTGLHYVDEAQVAIIKNSEAIFKDYNIFVQGKSYYPHEFLKILRNTKDGASGVPITQESSRLIETAYQMLILERNNAKRGGRKKGFLRSEKKLEQGPLDALRAAFRKLYSGDAEGDTSDDFVVLNNGVDFKETSETSVEMQLNENKITNAGEFAKIFHISTDVMSGKATEADASSLAKLAAIPLMTAIQCALNRDFLLESEKGELYWAFDTKELLKGSMKERYEAYKMALEAHFMQPDEVRYEEDLPALGLTWIPLGLNDVLYDPKTKLIYTPNTNKQVKMGEALNEPPADPPQLPADPPKLGEPNDGGEKKDGN